MTERTIYRLADAEKIPAYHVGGNWRFSRADIDEWIRRASPPWGSERFDDYTETLRIGSQPSCCQD